MQSIVFLRVAPLLLVVSAAAGAGTPVVEVEAAGWFGSIYLSEERLTVRVVRATADDLTLMVGSVKNEVGENMAFLVPTSGEGLITSTWTITSLDEKHPTILWSDGNCQLLEARTTKEPREIVDRAPWLGWGVRTPDVSLLSVVRDEVGSMWAVDQLFLGLKGFHPDGETEAGEFGEVDSTFSDDPAMQPEMLQEYWDEIVFRYFETRDRLRLVDSLRVVDEDDPPVEPEGGKQHDP